MATLTLEVLTFTCSYPGCTKDVSVMDILCKEHDQTVVTQCSGTEPIVIDYIEGADHQ